MLRYMAHQLSRVPKISSAKLAFECFLECMTFHVLVQSKFVPILFLASRICALKRLKITMRELGKDKMARSVTNKEKRNDKPYAAGDVIHE